MIALTRIESSAHEHWYDDLGQLPVRTFLKIRVLLECTIKISTGDRHLMPNIV